MSRSTAERRIFSQGGHWIVIVIEIAPFTCWHKTDNNQGATKWSSVFNNFRPASRISRAEMGAGLRIYKKPLLLRRVVISSHRVFVPQKIRQLAWVRCTKKLQLKIYNWLTVSSSKKRSDRSTFTSAVRFIWPPQAAMQGKALTMRLGSLVNHSSQISHLAATEWIVSITDRPAKCSRFEAPSTTDKYPLLDGYW